MAEDGVPVENGLDLVLLLLHAVSDGVAEGKYLEGSTRLQKLLFLLWKEGQFHELASDLYNFKAYDFGPCLDDIYDDLDFAESVGLIETREVPIDDSFADADSEAFASSFVRLAKRGASRKDFRLTRAGKNAATDLLSSLDPQHRDGLNKVVKQYGSLPIRRLLRYVYSKYPKFAVNSKIANTL